MSTTYWQQVLDRLDTKVSRMIDQIGGKCPHFAGNDGKFDDISSDWWTTGFWPGILWIMHDMTGKEHYRNAAWHWDAELEQWFVKPTEELHHDVGFQFLSTAVIKHTLTNDADALSRGLEAANFLAARYNPVGKFIRAWNADKFGWVIIDCMLNISLLYWASRVTGDPRYKHIAINHTETTMQYGIREDGSTKHILSFDPENGAYLESFGGQGLSVDSTWSRGTSWGLYGFTNAYRYTSDERYLHTAKRIAHYWIAALPEDQVPYWDFRIGPEDLQVKDSSGTSFIDVSLIFGDYYYVEAVAKLNGWKHRIY